MWYSREKKKEKKKRQNTDKVLTHSLNFIESNFIQNFGFPLQKKIFFEALSTQKKDLATIPSHCPKFLSHMGPFA